MLNKVINTGKLKVKYVLGNHTTIKGYPTAEDILFEMIRDYCGRVTKVLKFTDASLLQKYPNITKEYLIDILCKLKDDGYIVEVNSTSSYVTYEVIKNPYL